MNRVLVFALPVLLVSTLTLFAVSEQGKVFTYTEPIDAVSIGVPGDTIDLSLSTWIDGRWTEWKTLEIENESDPLLRESNLVMFPESVSAIRVRGTTTGYDVHPIRVSKEPAHYSVAAVRRMAPKLVLTRAEWGADESFTIDGDDSERSDNDVELDSNGTTSTSQRVQDCLDAQRDYPEEFATTRTVTHTADGQELRWAQRYSPQIKLLTVHHTALQVTGDERSAVERMRALYTYHSNSRGWGDIGYHYVIDEFGQAYEGRAGGDGVVGGHAYCANVGTIGIALMGSFELEKPTQEQMTALKELLALLSAKYRIDLKKDVMFHGKKFPVIVRHGDLVTTTCPGYFITASMPQIRTDLVSGNIRRPIILPTFAFREDRTSERKAARVAQASLVRKPTLTPLGSTTLIGAPGSQTIIQLSFTAGEASVSRRARIATVERSHPRIGVWQDLSGQQVRVREELLSPASLTAGSATPIQLTIQFPAQARHYTLKVGDITYTLQSEGRRVRTTPAVTPPESSVDFRTRTRYTATPMTSTQNGRMIRIRLGHEAETMNVTIDQPFALGDRQIAGATVTLTKENDLCVARAGEISVKSSAVRLDPGTGVSAIASWQKSANRFRGVLECRVVDGLLVLINELPLEYYLKGLAEEPDSEPYEKQRAFAIAARSYAAYYMDPLNRKFPSKPYDGDDSPARFQAYGGVFFEQSNPRWTEAVESTAHQVITKGGSIVKTPYFSSDNGKTRSPEEAGWRGFPFAEIFYSKLDPWCEGMPMNGHGVGMSGCGAEGQANTGKKAEEILKYYYPETEISTIN
jgi:hypothetical protein